MPTQEGVGKKSTHFRDSGNGSLIKWWKAKDKTWDTDAVTDRASVSPKGVC